MIHTLQAVVNGDGGVQLLQELSINSPKRALLIVFDEEYEESVYEKSLPYILSESSLAVDWNRQEEDQAWAYLQ